MTEHEPTTARVRFDGPRGPRGKPVLVVGHCRSRGSLDVLQAAADLAGRLGAVVQVVHAISLDDYPVDPDADDWEAQAAEVLEGQLAAVAEEHDALMIVVGTRGHGAGAALARLLNRSVSRAVIGRQRRPVLVVPAHST